MKKAVKELGWWALAAGIFAWELARALLGTGRTREGGK